MTIALVTLGVLLGLAATASAVGKLTRRTELVAQLAALGVPRPFVPVLGLLEVAGSAGLLIGIGVGPLGVAAAAGLTLYFTGAVGAHLRHRDRLRECLPAMVLLVVAVATLILETAR
jgi:hypothetical protein